MKIALAYDFETTGLPLFKEPSEHPDQPHFVQLGAALVDLDDRVVISQVDLIIRPDGWVIPDDTIEVHGITNELALAVGVPEREALQMLLAMWRRAYLRIGHNESFDARIARIAIKRHLADDALADAWKSGAAYCTCMESTGIMKMPPTANMRGGFKMPKLTEAFEFFTGKPMPNAHNAMGDVPGCLDVFFALQDRMADQPVAA